MSNTQKGNWIVQVVFEDGNTIEFCMWYLSLSQLVEKLDAQKYDYPRNITIIKANVE